MIQIVVRTLNRPLFLQRAIRSICEQSYFNWHCTVVNDGGNQKEVERIIDDMSHEYSFILEKFNIIHNINSRGMEAASNLGLKNFVADYYIIHDDDDSWDSNFLYNCITFFQNNTISSIQGVVGRTIKVNEEIRGNSIKIRSSKTLFSQVKSFTIPRVLQNNPFMPIAFMYSHEALEKVGFYDETLAVVGDWDFNIRFISFFDIAYVPEAIAFYHVRKKRFFNFYDNSISNNVKHSLYKSIIINKYVRESLNKNTSSIGSIIASVTVNYYITRFMEALLSIKNKFSSFRK